MGRDTKWGRLPVQKGREKKENESVTHRWFQTKWSWSIGLLLLGLCCLNASHVLHVSEAPRTVVLLVDIAALVLIMWGIVVLMRRR